MQRLSYLNETVLSNVITRNRIVLSFKDSPTKPLRRRPLTSISLCFLLQGSDPRAATCRGKLQSKRSKLNMEINKELMLRSGAENLYK